MKIKEVLVILGVVGVLANFVMQAMAAAYTPEDERHLFGCESNLKNIGTSLEMYATDNTGRYPKAGNLALLTPNYLKVIPTCPAAGKDTYTASYQSAHNPEAYTVYCKGNNHAVMGLKPNWPLFNSDEGLVKKGLNGHLVH